MAKEIIRCPHCGAAYRITEKMRQRIGKKARCASCKEVFTIELAGEEEILPPPSMNFEVLAAKDSMAQKVPSETLPAAESETAPREEIPQPEQESIRMTPVKPDDKRMPRPPSTPPAQIEIRTAETKSSRHFRVTGRRLAGSLIMLLLLIGQVVWMFRGDEKVYPLLEQTCETFSCSLPEMRDTTRLSVTNRLFSAVENKPGVYRLQLQIANKAPFPQPYPTIEISLIDSRGIVRARKRLSPDEYLEEYRPDERLAAKTRTEIGFMILSPATETTGFELEFL